MSASTWLTLATACLIIALTPGAGAVNTMTNAIGQGWRRDGWGVLGQELALVIQVIIVAVGLGAVVAALPAVLEVVRWVGAAYLVYLGLRMMFAEPVPVPQVTHEELATEAGTGPVTSGSVAAEQPRRESVPSLIRRGLLVNLLNPKAIIFFLAFIPPFIDASRAQAPQYAIVGATTVAVDVVVMWGFFALLARPLGRLMCTTRGQRILNIVFGCCFLLVAGLLLVV